MTASGTGALRVVLDEGAPAGPLPPAQRQALVSALLERGYEVSCRRTPVPGDGAAVVLGRFGGTVPRGDGRVRYQDVDGLAVPAVVEAVEAIREGRGVARPGAWKPWFPVIDYQRCTNCMQCLSFCLFDVYGVSADGKIQVRNQSNCKTECPACSRVCPEVAIMFPKYRHSPINGDEVSADDVRREAMKVDISALLGGDVYAALRDRSAKAKSRFSKERDDARALKERQTCLVKLQEQFDVPAEVLAALPSLEEIQAKAAAARARAREEAESRA